MGTVSAGLNSNVYNDGVGFHIGYGSDMAHVLHLGSVGSGLTAFVYGYSQGAHASPNGNVQGRCPRAPWVATVVGTVAAGWRSNVYSADFGNHIDLGVIWYMFCCSDDLAPA